MLSSIELIMFPSNVAWSKKTFALLPLNLAHSILANGKISFFIFERSMPKLVKKS